MNRRGFLGLLASTPIIAAAPDLLELLAPKRSIFLPPAGGWISRYLRGEGDFETATMRYVARERFSYAWTDPRGFTELSLEQMLIAVKKQADVAGVPIAIRPTHLIVHPSWTRNR